MTENTVSASVSFRNEVIKRLKDEDKVEFFLNTDLEPTVHIPKDGFGRDWPADHQRVQDLVVAVYYEVSHEKLLKSSEREILLSLIREDCRKGGRRLSDAEAERTEKDVIVQAILCLMNEQPEFEDKTSVLLNRLSRIQREGKISKTEEIPVFTNVFSRRLGRLVPVLKGYGVEVSFSHTEAGSQCKVVRLGSFVVEAGPDTSLPQPPDGTPTEPSGRPSGGTTMKGKDFRKADGADGETRFDDAKDKEVLKARRAELAGAGEKGGDE